MATWTRPAQKLRAVLSTLFHVAVDKTKKMRFRETWLPRSFQNPVTNVQAVAHEPKVPEPTTSEIRSYAATLSSADCPLRPDIRDALQLQLLTASRLTEVTALEWTEVDLGNGEWVLRAERSKNKQRHVVLLSALGLALLKRRRDWATPDVGFVFPRPTGPRQPIRSDLVQRALADNREKLELSAQFTSHNVRHAFTTWSAEKGYPVDVVNRCTAHIVVSGIDSHYSSATLNEPARKLWAAWAEWLA